MRVKSISLIFIIPAALIILPLTSYAGYGTLTWSANTDSDLSGYKIYYGITPRTGNTPPAGYTQGPIDVGKATTYDSTNLEGGQIYYFSVVAYDTSNNVSTFSPEVSKTIIAGDINNDKTVNIFDYNDFISKFSSVDCNNRSNIVGLGTNCKVDIFDYNSLVADFGKNSP